MSSMLRLSSCVVCVCVCVVVTCVTISVTISVIANVTMFSLFLFLLMFSFFIVSPFCCWLKKIVIVSLLHTSYADFSALNG